MEATIMKNSISKMFAKTNSVQFITMARKMFNALAALFTVVLAVQWYEAKGIPSLETISTMAVLGTMYALANKCQTYLLKLKIEELLPSLPVFGSEEPKRDN